MRPARIIAAVVFATAVAVTGCARSTADGPSASPQAPETAPPLVTASGTPPPTTGPSGGRPATSQAAPALADRISDPQVAADRLVDAWMRGDRAAARRLAGAAAVDRLFGEPPPARAPAALPCRLADLAVFVCSYPLAERAELTIVVEGGASAGYGVTGLECGD
jgi:hypothetical protein